jgi:hypothetical protein
MKRKLKIEKRFPFIVAGLVALLLGGVVLLRSRSSSQDPAIISNNPSPSSSLPPTPRFSSTPSPLSTSQPSVTTTPSPLAGETTLKLSNQTIPVPAWFNQLSLPLPTRNPSKWGLLSYSSPQLPQFIRDPQLQSVVDSILELVKSKSLSKNNLSISLIDTSNNKFAGYRDDVPQFPASVAKMFWLVALEGQIQNGMWNHANSFTPFITKMMKESDNDSSSFIIDMMTDTHSDKNNLKEQEFQTLLLKRKFYINSFFNNAGYHDIDIIQKTYPIPYLELQEPKGSELQIRLQPANPAPKPIRNRVSTIDAAKLMYQICHSQQAITPESSKRMCALLKKDINPKSWKSIKKEDFNPIETFFGEFISIENSKSIELFSKAGWTPNSRKEVAMIRMRNRQKSYILAVFAEDPKYGKDKTIFPEISRLVYRKMHDPK